MVASRAVSLRLDLVWAGKAGLVMSMTPAREHLNEHLKAKEALEAILRWQDKQTKRMAQKRKWAIERKTRRRAGRL